MKPHSRKYTRRKNSNGGDVYPTVCATQYKLPQRQGDMQGAYVLEYFVRHKHEKKVSPIANIKSNMI